jgi:hypothetical protein
LATALTPPTAVSKYEILEKDRSVLDTFNKLHKDLYKYRCIAGSSKPLSLLLTNILTAVKEKLQTYWATTYARSGVNQM